MPRSQPQNARESRAYLRAKYANEASTYDKMADMGDASGFKDISASTGAMRNVAARSRHYANTAAAMQSRHQDFAASVAADTSDANGADDQRQYLNRFRRIGGAKGTTKGGSL